MARKKPSPNWFLCVSLIRSVTRIYAENKTGRQFCVLSFRYDKGGPYVDQKQNKTKQNKRPALLSGFFAIEFTKQDASFVKPPGVHIYKTKHEFHQRSYVFVQCRMCNVSPAAKGLVLGTGISVTLSKES